MDKSEKGISKIIKSNHDQFYSFDPLEQSFIRLKSLLYDFRLIVYYLLPETKKYIENYEEIGRIRNLWNLRKSKSELDELLKDEFEILPIIYSNLANEIQNLSINYVSTFQEEIKSFINLRNESLEIELMLNYFKTQIEHFESESSVIPGLQFINEILSENKKVKLLNDYMLLEAMGKIKNIIQSSRKVLISTIQRCLNDAMEIKQLGKFNNLKQTTLSYKLLVLNETGIINFLYQQFEDFNSRQIAKVLSEILEVNFSSITPSLSYLISKDKENKNSPYKNPKNKIQWEQFLKEINNN